MHIISIVYQLVGSIVSVNKGLFNPTPMGCRIAEYPPKCDLNDKVRCIRGSDSKMYVWLFTGVAMGSIIFFVKKRERFMNRRLSFSTNSLCQSSHTIKQSRAVMIQGIFYVGSFILVFIFPSVYTLSRTKPIFLVVLSQLFWPLQGFLNSLIYFWPRYTKSRGEFKDQSFCWIVKDMIFSTTLEKERRRAVLQSIRRRKGASLMASTSKRRQSGFSLKDDTESTAANGNLTSSYHVSSLVIIGSDNVIDESSSSTMNDIDGDPVVKLKYLRAEFVKEAEMDSSDECEEEFDDAMIAIAATHFDKV